jgi:hypothetical protein
MLWLPSGIFEPAPPDHKAVATTTGLALNCANSALYMAVSGPDTHMPSAAW